MSAVDDTELIGQAVGRLILEWLKKWEALQGETPEQDMARYVREYFEERGIKLAEVTVEKYGDEYMVNVTLGTRPERVEVNLTDLPLEENDGRTSEPS